LCEIFTGDATWCCHYDQETNHKASSEKTSASQNPKKSSMMKSHVKTVPTASCDIWGLFIANSSHKTKQSEILMRLHLATSIKMSASAQQLVLHHDNTPAHQLLSFKVVYGIKTCN